MRVKVRAGARFKCRAVFRRKFWFALELGLGFRVRVIVRVSCRVTILCE